MNKTLFEIDPERCTMCFTCIRECPVKAIEVVTTRDYARIIPKRCIECGSCLRACPEKAVAVFNSKDRVRNLLNSEIPIVAIVAPSVSGEFTDITDYRKFVKMLHNIGFKYVHEASFGVDLIGALYKRFFKSFNGKHYITSCCPVVTNYIEKYHPDLVDNLVPISSPMIMMTAVVRELYGEDIKVVYIGPCIASKNEGERYEVKYQPDAVLTFTELRSLFSEKNISEKQVEYAEFDQPWGNRGGLFPIGEGILQVEDINTNLVSGHVVSVEGKEDFLESITHFSNHAEKIRKFFNVFYCNGCIMGPGMSPNGQKYVRRSAVIQFVKLRLKYFDPDQWSSYINKYSFLNPQPIFQSNDQRISTSSNEVKAILKELEFKHSNPNYGCMSCGYKSCVDLAEAVSKGLASLEMCLTYSIRDRRAYARQLQLLQGDLDTVEKELIYQEKKASLESSFAYEAHETIISVLQEIPSAVVIVNEDFRIMQCNRNFVKQIGNEAEEIIEVVPGLVGADLKSLLPFHFHKLFYYVMKYNENIMDRDLFLNDRFYNVSIFTIKKNCLVGAILRDMYMPEVQKEQVISRVHDVVENNFSMVQKIGFLLGEGAAETEQMLNSIIESYSNKESS